ncbi:probable GMP synthase [glutamine-hydrolyzing] [Lolium rigidum]|uniref:probable GMP synthase [glutamine-hydrolyzing] n=1 Tax=Lolium rigidum TaxID=89674 RepID=UPI001F5DCB4B|nr:probable GMP synthase [glutamine-hydrolyzing] [Lolium rigidum]
MAGAPRVRSLNIAAPEADARPVLVPGGNKAPAAARKPSPKPLRKAAEAAPVKPPSSPLTAATAGADGGARKGSSPLTAAAARGDSGARKGSSPLPSPRRTPPRKLHDVPALNASLSASCSSDASVESLRRGRASGGRTERSWSRPAAPKRGKVAGKVAAKEADDAEFIAPVTPEAVQGKRRCAWVTPTSDPYYVTFHDEEWGVPVHDDRRLFELLVLSGALAELSWSEILKRRQNFREIFMDFDPVAVSKVNEKKLVAPGSIANSLLSEQKLRAVLENARQIVKIADEFGSFSQYCWGFLNHKPIISKFRYPRQVPVKSPKADTISKDMVRRGFRGVGPTVVYSFMQAAGLTNDHLVSCFRFKECDAPPSISGTDRVNTELDENKDEPRTKSRGVEMRAKEDLSRAIDTLTIS